MLRFRKRIILLTVIAFIFAYIQGGNLPYSIFYCLILVEIFAIIYIYIINKSLYIRVDFNRKSYNTGDKDIFKIVIRNSSILAAPYLTVKSESLKLFNNKYNGDLIYIGPNGNKWIKNSIDFHIRGVYNFGKVSLEIKDLFDIFRISKVIDRNVNLKVYPRIYDVNTILPKSGDDYIHFIHSKSGKEEISAVSDVRKYIVGDSLKKVHWKLSAKYGELYVKNYEKIAGEECNLFLDMNKNNMFFDNNGKTEEYMIEFFVSIVNYLVNNKINSKIFINALKSKNFNVENKEGFKSLMEHMISQKSDGENEFAKFITANLTHVQKLSWIGIITIEINKKLTKEFIKLRDYGYRITVYYYGNVVSDIDNIKQLINVGIECISFNEIINKDHK